MCVNLSELNNNTMLLIGENCIMDKEDFIKEIEEHRSKEVYTTTEYRASIDVKDMLNTAIDCEACNMYEDWENDIWEDISDEDISELQSIVDRILSGSRNISYIADKKVKIDI